MISILDRYIGRSVIFSTAMVLLILLGLLTVIQVFDGINQIGKGTYTAKTMLVLVLLQMPSRLYEIFPIATLIGATAGLSLLALNYELVAIRAGGVSLMRIITSVLKVSALFVVMAIILGELVVPVTGDLAERTRAEALNSGLQKRQAGIWFRDGGEFISIEEVLPDLTLRNIRIYRFDEDGRLVLQRQALEAKLKKGVWALSGVQATQLDAKQLVTTSTTREKWQTKLTPELVGVFTLHPQFMPSWSLYRHIGHLQKNQQDTTRYRHALWSKILMPVSTVIMLLLAIPFVFGQIRSGGLGQRVFIGVMLGMFYGLLQGGLGYYGLAGHLGSLYGVPPSISAALPGLLFLFLAILLIRRIV
jgi:lipopolysaccharide export system permease protein